MKDDKGFAFIETIVAIALLGVVAVIFLGGIGTATSATVVADEQATAESLARSEIEYIKSCAYQYFTAEYPIDPVLDIPDGWTAEIKIEGNGWSEEVDGNTAEFSLGVCETVTITFTNRPPDFVIPEAPLGTLLILVAMIVAYLVNNKQRIPLIK